MVYTDFRPTPLQHYVFPSGGDGLYMVVDENSKFKNENFTKAVAAISQADTNDTSKSKGKKGSKQGSKESEDSDIFKIIKMIMERRYDPVSILLVVQLIFNMHAYPANPTCIHLCRVCIVRKGLVNLFLPGEHHSFSNHYVCECFLKAEFAS